MWSNIVKKNDTTDLNENKTKKIIKSNSDLKEIEKINIFESYHTSKCIDFIIDITFCFICK